MKIDLDINDNYEEVTVVIKAPSIDDVVMDIMEKLKSESKKEKSIVGKKNQKVYILNPKDIIMFYSEEQKVLADTSEGSFEIKMKLYEIEELLAKTSFVRISKFTIVNVKRINNIELFFNGSLIINLSNGKQETISRRYVKQVKEFIGMEGK
ncbi:LytTR family DNA-binding domain-containing protein [uncultured Clostridium sp.]|uniref:LytTR family DNA-binding domain-containing protein n=1 Tax=uncultured Clostridium sp. TaxID=59620 RepID=UPI00262798CD|nr:LytTR family DNA-binding domain-containing protein [uncultured Clostridium sp.]